MSTPCPTCKKAIPATATTRPFCSVRCRQADLGKWLAGDYRIPTAERQDQPSDDGSASFDPALHESER